MIASFALILVCQLVGEAAARLFGLAIPGPVIGLLLFTGLLGIVRPLMARVEPVANQLLAHFSLLFVPAAVGVIQHLDRLSSAFVPIAAALVGSTALTLLVAATTFRLVARWQDGRSSTTGEGA